MTEPIETRNDTSCDISNDTNVINHGGLVTNRNADSPTAISAENKSLVAGEVVNINEHNGNKKPAEENAHVSELTEEKSMASELPPLVRPKLDNMDTKAAATNSNLNKASKLSESPGGNINSASNEVESSDVKERAGEDPNANKTSLNAYHQSRTDSADQPNGAANKVIPTSVSKSPPPVPRRQLEKVKYDVKLYGPHTNI